MVKLLRKLALASGWLLLCVRALSAQVPFSLDVDGYIHSWIVRGPFPARQPEDIHVDFLTALGGESAVLGWNEVDSVHWGSPVQQSKNFWQGVITEGIVLSFHRFLQPAEFGVAYAAVWLRSPRRQSAVLKVGSDDGVQIWLNGKKIHENPVYRSWEPDADEIPVQLKAGDNFLLAKVSQGRGGWQLSVRLCSSDGEPLRGVRVLLPGNLTSQIKLQAIRKSLRLRLEARYSDKKPVLVAVLRYSPVLQDLPWDLRLKGAIYRGNRKILDNVLRFSWNATKPVHFVRPVPAPEKPGIYELKPRLELNGNSVDLEGILFFW